MSKSNHQKRGALRPVLYGLLIVCIGGAGLLGYLAYREYMDRQQGLSFYQSLVSTDLPIATEEAFPPMQHTSAVAVVKAPAPTAVQMAGETEQPQEHETKSIPLPSLTATETPMPEAMPTDALAVAEPLVQSTATPNPSAMDFGTLQAQYPDVVGWIRLEDTVIDYPILQGEDNDFYLHHLPDGTPNKSGCIMMDRSNDADFGDDITILHGHHMKNGSMFASLEKYASASYYQKHPKFRLLTPNGDFDVAVFAAYTVDVSTFGYPTVFESDEKFEQFLADAIRKTRYQADVKPTCEDRILMLSTCNYAFGGARYIVLGIIEGIENHTEPCVS